METRKFKPGDWVAVKGELNSPLMQVMNYYGPSSANNWDIGSNFVRCVYYRNGDRFEKTLHQSRLIKRRLHKDVRANGFLSTGM